METKFVQTPLMEVSKEC